MHGPPVTDGAERINNYFQFKRRTSKALSESSQGRKSNLDIQHTRDMDRPTFYYENIVYPFLKNNDF